MSLVKIFKKMTTEQAILKRQIILAERELLLLDYLIEEMSNSDKEKMRDLKKRRAGLIFRIEKHKEESVKKGTASLQSSKDWLKDTEKKLKDVENKLKKYEDSEEKESQERSEEPDVDSQEKSEGPDVDSQENSEEPKTSKDLTDIENELENKEKDLETDIEKKTQNLDAVKADAEEIQNNVEELSSDSEALDAEIKQNQTKGEELENNKQELDDEIKAAEEKQKEIDNKVADAETEVKELEKEKEKLEKEKAEIEKEKEEQIEKEKEEVIDKAVSATTNNAIPNQGLNDVPKEMSKEKEVAKEDFVKNVKHITDNISSKLDKNEKKSFPRETLESLVGNGFSMMQALLNVVQVDNKGFSDIFVETPGKILGGVYKNYTEIERRKIAKRMGLPLKVEYAKIANNLKATANEINNDEEILKSYNKSTQALQKQAKTHVDTINKLNKKYKDYLEALDELDSSYKLDDDEKLELLHRIDTFESEGLDINLYIEQRQKAEVEIKKIDKTVNDKFTENEQFFKDAMHRKEEYNKISKAKDNVISFLDDAKEVAWNGFDKNEFNSYAEEYEIETVENDFEVGYDYERESKDTSKLIKQLEKLKREESERQIEKAEEEKRDKDMRDALEKERLDDLKKEKDIDSTDNEEYEFEESETDEEL